MEGISVDYTEEQETYLQLKQELGRVYGKPTKKDSKEGRVFLYNNKMIRLIPRDLKVEFSNLDKREIPKEIGRLITKLQQLNN